MGISESEERLREYIEKDIIYQDYKKSNKEPSDFERFCFVHCRDIENVLDENQQLKINCNIGNENLNFYRDECKKYKSLLDEIREYIKEKEKDGTLWSVKATDDLLQILDKVKE